MQGRHSVHVMQMSQGATEQAASAEEISASVMPSAKYSSSARPVRFSNGRTAIERMGLRTGLPGIGLGSGVCLSRIC